MDASQTRHAVKVEARAECWRRGNLSYLLDSNQLKLEAALLGCGRKRFAAKMARRVGKSFWLCKLASETCLRHPGGRVNYGAATSDMVANIIHPIMTSMVADAPTPIRPILVNGRWRFHNGSYIVPAGCEDLHKANHLRGTESLLNIVDEAGFIPILRPVLTEILNPQLLSTDGLSVIASSPPESSGHDFAQMYRSLEAMGATYTSTVYDCPRYGREQLNRFMAEDAALLGLTPEAYALTPSFKREWLAQFVTDPTRAVVPEWDDEMAVKCVRVEPRPKFFHAYESLDIGWKDKHGVLFAYWDFFRARLVIEDELLLSKTNTQKLADSIKAKEFELWGSKAPHLRVADNDLLVIGDLQELHSLSFYPTAKDDKELQVNRLRMLVGAGQLEINPRCVQLIRQLSVTIWNSARSSYERNSEGHGDLIDALVYLVRNVRRDLNPVPAGYGLDENRQWISKRAPSGNSVALKKLISRS